MGQLEPYSTSRYMMVPMVVENPNLEYEYIRAAFAVGSDWAQ
jgi:hypothetical protein